MASPAPVTGNPAPSRRRRQRGEGEVPLIWVAAGDDLDPGQTALWERDRRHPLTGRELTTDVGGEVTVKKGGPPVQVARTGLVLQKLANGDLQELDDDTAQELLAEWQAARDAKRARNTAIRERDRQRTIQANENIVAAQARIAAIQEVAASEERIRKLEDERDEHKATAEAVKADLAALRQEFEAIKAGQPTPPDNSPTDNAGGTETGGTGGAGGEGGTGADPATAGTTNGNTTTASGKKSK